MNIFKRIEKIILGAGQERREGEKNEFFIYTENRIGSFILSITIPRLWLALLRYH